MAPTPLVLTDTSDLERAMAATLKRLDTKSETAGKTEATTSEILNDTKPIKLKTEKVVPEPEEDPQESLKKRQADRFRELIQHKVSLVFIKINIFLVSRVSCQYEHVLGTSG